MLKFRAWMLLVVVLLSSVVGCASTDSDRSTRDSGHAAGVEHGSCH
jgi:hypothetical protein